MREQLSQLLGQEHVLDHENDLLAYSYDSSGLQGSTKIVLLPHTLEELHKILIFANRTNSPLVARGLGTNPLGMVVPHNAIVVDMGRFERIHTLNLKEEWVQVDAGVVLKDLQKLLLKHGYTFPIYPLSASTSTIGALLATNQMDRRSYRYGRLNEHVLEVEYLDGTGKHYQKGDARVLGMEGTSVIIVSAKIKIRKIEPVTTVSQFALETIPDVLEKMRECKEDLTVLSVEYMCPKASRLQGLQKTHHLIVEYGSDNGEIVNQEAQAKAIQKRTGAWSACAREGYTIIEDCQVSEEQLFDLIAWCNDIDVPLVGHIGMGIMHPFFTQEFDRSTFYDLLSHMDANLSGQFGYGLVKKQFVPRSMKDKLIQTKDEYDFNDIIGRGLVHDYH